MQKNIDAMKKEIAHTLALVLQQPVPADGDLTMRACPAWTSLAHVEVILTLEERFGISFEPQDIPYLTSQSSIAAKTHELLRAVRTNIND